MRKFLSLFAILLLYVGSVNAQCSAGYTQASLNWDNLDFLKQDPTYISASQAQTQYFAFGTNRLTFTHNFSMANTAGETFNQTGKTGTNKMGADVEFSGNGTITLTFNTAVSNIEFTIHDVEKGQSVSLTAFEGAIPRNISLATCAASGTTSLTIFNNNSNTPSVRSLDGKNAIGDVDNNTNLGSFNVSIAGPVTNISFTTSIVSPGFNSTGTNPDFFLSDISACTNTVAFPTNYYAISQPYTNQPGYVLSALNNSIYIINPANGAARILFTDPSGNNINSMGYDPYNKFLYYSYSLTGGGSPAVVNPNNKSIQKYDVNTGAISTIISNVNTLGIPTYTSGVESGGAAFYNGAFYIGIEGINGDESKVWRIDFDGSGNAIVPARQVFAIPTDGHDWSDFAISNGVLYDFDGKGGGGLENVYHINLQTGATNATYNSAALGFVPRQVAVDWTEKLYNTGAAVATSTGTIVPYANGAITTAQQYGITSGGTSPSGSWGDAAEAFKPKADFGDAPASFDPNPLAPAMHELDANLRLGASFDEEWNKPAVLGTNADADGADENGLAYVALLNQNSGNYYSQVNVYNNTGTNATLAAWVDFNNNGVFDTGEGISKTVATNTLSQAIDLNWTGIGNSLVAGTNVYLRIRLTSAANNMTTANPTGYFGNGEVEDYRVIVNGVPLDVVMLDFVGNKIVNEKVSLKWKVAGEEPGTVYELQRSNDANSWTTIFTKTVVTPTAVNQYEFIDDYSGKPVSYYRIQYVDASGKAHFTAIKKIQFSIFTAVHLSPNPAKNNVYMGVDAKYSGRFELFVYDMEGKKIHSQLLTIEKGINSIPLSFPEKLNNGIYSLQITLPDQQYIKKLMIQK